MHNDNLLILDEIGEASSDDVYQVAYMLVNGRGKERMKKDTHLREASTWKLNFLSTGEIPLSEKIAESGKRKVKAGQEVRMINLPVTAIGEYGAFENLHGCKSGAEFSNLLKANATKYYGAPSQAFIKTLCGETMGEMERNIAEIASLMKDFVNRHCPHGSSGQVERVLRIFALIAAVGSFLCNQQILPWTAKDAESVALKWFHIWLKERGTLGSKEIETAINNIQEHWALNWRKTSFDLYEARHSVLYGEIDGYKERDKKTGKMICYMLSGTFSELIKGCNRWDVLDELDKRGMLHHTKNGKPKKTVAIGKPNVRVYALLFPDPENGKGDEQSLTSRGDKMEELDTDF